MKLKLAIVVQILSHGRMPLLLSLQKGMWNLRQDENLFDIHFLAG